MALAGLDRRRTVHLVDRDALAVDFAQQNGELNNLHNVVIYGSLGYDAVTERDFDLIVSNVPGKAGEDVITHLVRGARPFLSPTGHTAIVVVTPLATEADSIVIHWPSGKIEKYNQLIAGKSYYIQEGKCMTAQVELFQDQLIVKVSNLTISAPSGWPFYLWSTGNISASI